MDGWDTQDMEEIVRGRRMRVGRRRSGGGRAVWVVLSLVLLAGVGAGAWYWLHRSKGTETIPNPAVVAPGGFNATINDSHTITVGLEVRNTANVAVTLLAARIVAPAGLTSTTITLIPTGAENQGFALDGDLPAAEPVRLGTGATDRGAIVAARFTVDCKQLLAASNDLDEQIFVTVQVAGTEREEELTPPVVGDVQWLAASAQRVCTDPVPSGTQSGDQPLPPDTGATPSP